MIMIYLLLGGIFTMFTVIYAGAMALRKKR